MLSFKWRQFEKDIILLVERWYTSYSLSYRDIEEMMLERNVKSITLLLIVGLFITLLYLKMNSEKNINKKSVAVGEWMRHI